MFLDPDQPFRTDDSGMAPGGLAGIASGIQQPHNVRYPRLVNWFRRQMPGLNLPQLGGQQPQAAEQPLPQPTAQTAPMAQQPMMPQQQGARLGQLYSGYGY